MAYRSPWRALPGLAALTIAMAALARPAQAEPPPPPAPAGTRSAPQLEAWLGGQAFGEVWSLYSGASWAPFGDVRADGLRLRAVLGSGAYDNGSVAFADVLIGYHRQLGPVTLKVFVGLTATDHYPTDDTSMLDGTALGPKVVLESWWTISGQAWASLDLAVSAPQMHADLADDVDHNRVEHASRLRLGWRLWPALSIGLEGGAGGPLAPTLQTTWQKETAYTGGFLRYEWEGGEVSVSGGAFVDGNEEEAHAHPFATVSVLTRF